MSNGGLVPRPRGIDGEQPHEREHRGNASNCDERVRGEDQFASGQFHRVSIDTAAVRSISGRNMTDSRSPRGCDGQRSSLLPQREASP
jgi:hypothetical protein